MEPTLPWSPSDPTADVEPIFRVVPVAAGVLGSGSSPDSHPGWSDAASSTPLPAVSAGGGLGPISNHRLASLRAAVPLRSAPSPVVPTPASPARATPVVRPKRGLNFHHTLPLLPLPTFNHFAPLDSENEFPSLSTSFVLPKKMGSHRQSKPQSRPKHRPSKAAHHTLLGSSLRPSRRPSGSTVASATMPTVAMPPPAVSLSGISSTSARASVTTDATAAAGPAAGIAERKGLSTDTLSSAPASGSTSLGSVSSGSEPSKVELEKMGPTQAVGSTAAASADMAKNKLLILGSSMVRHVKIQGAITHSISGATVKEIHSSLPQLLLDHPQLTSIAIHVGANDLKFKQTESHKDDFRSLIHSIISSNLSLIISGPFISPRYNDEQYSRMRALHVWLKGYCCNLSIPYVDNYALFFGCGGAFVWDGSLGGDRLHLNRLGARLLSQSIELTAKSVAWTRRGIDGGPMPASPKKS